MPTLQEIIIAAATEAGHCFSGTADASSSETALVDTTLLDSGVGADFLAGAYIARFSAATATDRQRRLGAEPFSTSIASLTPPRAWSAAPDGETYHVFSLAPAIAQAGLPYSWMQACNAFLQHARNRYPQRVLLARDLDSERRYRLTQSEHIMIAVLAVEGGTAVTITPPSGWTLVRRSDDGTTLALATYSKRYVAGDAAVIDFTLDSSRAAAGVIAVLSDVRVTSPVNVSAEATEASGTAPTAPTATTTINGCYVLRVFASATEATFRPPDDHDELYDMEAERPAAAVAIEVAGALQALAGATGTADATALTAIAATMQTLAIAPRSTLREVRPVDVTGGDNGSGATTLSIARPAAVPDDDWIADERAVAGVFFRSVVSGQVVETDCTRNGNDYRVHQDGAELVVELLHGPSTTQDVVMEIIRPFPPLVALGDVTACPLTVAEAGTRWQMYEYLNRQPTTRGLYEGERAQAERDFRARYRAPRLRMKV